MRYKAYLFDVQGTLLDFFEPVSHAVAEYDPDIDAAAFTRAWRADYFDRVANLAQSVDGWTRVQDLYAHGFADVCESFGLRRPDSATAEVVASGWQRLVPWPDAQEIGMGTVFVSRPYEYGDPALAHDDPDREFDQRVTDIGAIA